MVHGGLGLFMAWTVCPCYLASCSLCLPLAARPLLPPGKPLDPNSAAARAYGLKPDLFHRELLEHIGLGD